MRHFETHSLCIHFTFLALAGIHVKREVIQNSIYSVHSMARTKAKIFNAAIVVFINHHMTSRVRVFTDTVTLCVRFLFYNLMLHSIDPRPNRKTSKLCVLEQKFFVHFRPCPCYFRWRPTPFHSIATKYIAASALLLFLSALRMVWIHCFENYFWVETVLACAPIFHWKSLLQVFRHHFVQMSYTEEV